MKDLTSSVYTFEDLIQGNFLYIDKTEYIWNLIRPAKGMYFLSRPRRFGKSLTLSTLKAVFQGKKNLFRGLTIYDKPYDWKQYPVIHLSFGDYNPINNTQDKLNAYLLEKIISIADSHSIVLPHVDDPSLAFGKLIDMLAKTSDVVILVDEYDKPILDNITNPNISEIQKCLKGFYSVLKDRNHAERFLFVTGVSKFSHVSVFSDLNNLTDITMDARYATMLGYTQEELETNFADRIENVAGNQNSENFKQKIKTWYNGYRFHKNSVTVYNPVSLAKFFESGGEFNNYWFSTGTPSFLMQLIRQKHMNLEQAIKEPATDLVFNAFEIDNIPPLSLLLQTGYLTIRSSSIKYNRTKYNLDFPNREVSESFNTYLLNDYSRKNQNDVANFCEHLTDAVVDGKLPEFQKTLEVFFAGIPYDLSHKDEANFQNIFYAVFKLLNFNVHAESRTSDGRIDAFIETDKYIYLFEFKLNKDKSALSQIKEKEYFKPFLLSPQKIILVGANFDTETGKLSNWQSEDFVK